MYKKNIPFRDYNGKPRNREVAFYLDERDVFKLLTELKVVFDWQDTIKGDPREMPTEEVVEFYTAFEEVLLSSYGEIVNDGLEFDRRGRYSFAQSAAFNACMVMFLEEPSETQVMISKIMPEGLENMVRKAAANLEALEANPELSSDERAELARLRSLAISSEPALQQSPGTPAAQA